MKSMLEHLAERHISKPAAWLSAFDMQVGLEAKCLVKKFFTSQIVYYPGSGNDGSPVRLFNTAGAADCFLYVDYMLERDVLLKQIGSRGFKGYHTCSRIELEPADFGVKRWSPHLTSTEMRKAIQPTVEPYGFLEILEKTDLRVPGHERLAILFMCADGHAAYDALFCQPDSPSPPFAMVIQDHGFGGNWSEFGNGGALHMIAMRAGIVPELMLVGDNSLSWAGFARIEGVAGVCVDNRQWRYLEARLPFRV
jgi:hypothetical protein